MKLRLEKLQNCKKRRINRCKVRLSNYKESLIHFLIKTIWNGNKKRRGIDISWMIEIPNFSCCATERRMKNLIKRITTKRGDLCINTGDTAEAFKKYFTNLFISNCPTQEDIPKCAQTIDSKVMREMNYNLNKTYIREEVELAIREIALLKSPGTDGLAACFYQHHWKTIGKPQYQLYFYYFYH